MSSDFIHRFEPAPVAGEPTLLVLHGTGGDENDLIPLARLISPRAALLSPRGQVLENGMPRFFRRIAEGVFDLEDLALRTRELGAFVEGSAKAYGLDAGRIYAVGYSNGANVAASLMLSRPELLAGGVLLRPMVPFEPDTTPALDGKPVLLSAGRQDPIVPQGLTERLAALLQSGGADVTLAWQDTGHQLLRGELEAAARWFAAHTSGKP
jgi:predicted esterase